MRTISVSEAGATRRYFRRGASFDERIRKTTDCWYWLAGCDGHGYGLLHIDGQKVKAHRYAYERAHGPIPAGLLVRHRCDNPKCVNPAHLDIGTVADNARDAVERDRLNPPRGIAHPRGKFTDEQIAQVHHLHQSGLSNLAIAETTGVSPSYVCHVLKGRARA